MVSIWMIATNTFREILAMRLVYAVLLVGGGILMLMTIPMALFEIATSSGDETFLHEAKLSFLYMILYSFWLLSLVLALLLGSMAVPNEIKRRTIVTILPRPVDRWQFLTGKLLGTASFLLIVQTVGMLLAAAVVIYFQFYPSTLIGYCVLSFYTSTMLCLLIAFSIASLSSPATGFALTVVWLYLVPGAVWGLSLFNDPYIERFVTIATHVLPARFADDLVDLSFKTEVIAPNHALYQFTLAENTLHGVVFFCLACLLFTRRQIVVTG